jgi:hypothetical protein
MLSSSSEREDIVLDDHPNMQLERPTSIVINNLKLQCEENHQESIVDDSIPKSKHREQGLTISSAFIFTILTLIYRLIS